MLDQQKLFKALDVLKDEFLHASHDECTFALQQWKKIENDDALRNCKQSSLFVPTWDGEFKETKKINHEQMEYPIIAVDGSQIYPDRHEGLPCALVHIGGLYIHYKKQNYPEQDSPEQNSSVEFFSEPYVYRARYSEGHELSADIIDCHRHELELKTALHMALHYEKKYGEKFRQAGPAQVRTVVFFDGSLIFWHLEGKPRLKELYFDRYCALLQKFYEHRILLVSYISLPKSKELINIIRCCDTENTYNTIVDADLMAHVLKPYERSTIFANHAPITQSYPSEMKPYFFYVNGGHEVGRVEIPRWLVKDPAFNRIESIIIDQIIKGDGYPIMLAEAHEKAVIKTRDRLVFCRLLEQYGCQSLGISRKLHKKQRPCV